MVELALVAPTLLLLILATLDFGRAVAAYVTVSSASREGARYAILNPTAPPSDIVAAVQSRSIPLDTAKLNVAALFYDGATFQPWPASGLPASVPKPKPIAVRVEVSYPWSAATWLVGGFFAGGTGSPTFWASSTMEARR